MNNLDFDFFLGVVIPLISFLTGVFTTTLFWIRNYAERRTEAALKNYAAERDFGHLKRNYETLSISIADLIDRQERGFDRLADLIRERDGNL